jgi:hypothetical protein
MARGTNLASVDGNFSHTPALLCTLQMSIQHSRLLHQAVQIQAEQTGICHPQRTKAAFKIGGKCLHK